jgi:hypothetical protein
VCRSASWGLVALEPGGQDLYDPEGYKAKAEIDQGSEVGLEADVAGWLGQAFLQQKIRGVTHQYSQQSMREIGC